MSAGLTGWTFCHPPAPKASMWPSRCVLRRKAGGGRLSPTQFGPQPHTPAFTARTRTWAPALMGKRPADAEGVPPTESGRGLVSQRGRDRVSHSQCHPDWPAPFLGFARRSPSWEALRWGNRVLLCVAGKPAAGPSCLSRRGRLAWLGCGRGRRNEMMLLLQEPRKLPGSSSLAP